MQADSLLLSWKSHLFRLYLRCGHPSLPGLLQPRPHPPHIQLLSGPNPLLGQTPTLTALSTEGFLAVAPICYPAHASAVRSPKRPLRFKSPRSAHTPFLPPIPHLSSEPQHPRIPQQLLRSLLIWHDKPGLSVESAVGEILLAGSKWYFFKGWGLLVDWV